MWPYISRIYHLSKFDPLECLRLLYESAAEINLVVPPAYRLIFARLLLGLCKQLNPHEIFPSHLLEPFYRDFIEHGESLLFELVSLFSIGDACASAVVLKVIQEFAPGLEESVGIFLSEQLRHQSQLRNSGILEKILLQKTLIALSAGGSPTPRTVRQTGVSEIKHGIVIPESCPIVGSSLSKRHELRYQICNFDSKELPLT